MAENVTLLRVFVSSPGDVAEERQLLEEAVNRVNQSVGMEHCVILQLWKWEENALRRIGASPQQIIDEQLPQYDIYLGILGARFGTPTDGYGSGTEKEFNDALERLERGELNWIMFYFRTAIDPPRTKEELSQYGGVLEFKSDVNERGLYREYRDVRGRKDAFLECVEDDLRRIVAAGQHLKPPTQPESDQLPNLNCQEGDKELTKEATDGILEQFGFFEPTTALDERDQIVERARRAVFDVNSPAYLLDTTFHFLDWNTAFDELVAKPLTLNRRKHALEFIQRLENCSEVIRRSQKLFGFKKKNPIIDIEPLEYRSPTFGMIKFRKIAAQIIDRHGKSLAWIVTLNIEQVEKAEELWAVLQERLTDEFNWTRYAVSYDRLLVPFQSYNNLINKVVDMIGEARVCADLGAGTGNGTIRLLESNPDRIVWAIDSSEGMLQYLRSKAHRRAEDDDSVLTRLTTVKGNLQRLTSLREHKDFFDAAMMVNVLYAVEDPLACLKRAYQLLKPAGILVLTTSHSETDVPKLFSEMRRNLTQQKLFTSLRDLYKDAKAVHKRMDHLIHRDTKEMIRNYLDEAGFDIEHEEPEYVDSVVLIKAVKREEW